jgi:hypothetical protein
MKYQLILLCALIFSSCSLFERVSGTYVDEEQFELARQAKIMSLQSESSAKLAQRISSGKPIEDGDIVFYISQDFLNKIVRQYETSSGWLDGSTSYVINRVKLVLQNGSAVASLSLTAHSDKYNVDVALVLDCLVLIESKEKELTIKLEPFNIAPDVSTGVVLGPAKKIIKNLILINLAKIGENMPPMKIPVDFSNQMQVPETKMNIKDKINLVVYSPPKNINTTFKLNEILIFDGKVLVSLNLENISIK